MDWKIIGISALINSALTIVLSLIYVPLLFLGPIIGGFLSSYLSKGYEEYATMDRIDGAVVGAISGLIGGLIIFLISILGFGAVGAIIGLIFASVGVTVNNALITGYIIFEFSVGVSFFLGLIGGVIGVVLKE